MKEELKEEIFSGLKAILAAYVPPMKLKSDTPICYELIADKEAVLNGKKRNETYFASAMKNKDFVGFYLFHIYMHPDLIAELSPDLKKTLKGKSCFHIKRWDEKMKKDVSDALTKGLKCYKEKNYV